VRSHWARGAQTAGPLETIEHSDYDVIVAAAATPVPACVMRAIRASPPFLLRTHTDLVPMSCNPAIGGIAKGNGGRDDRCARRHHGAGDRYDATIQFRMLIVSKGPAGLGAAKPSVIARCTAARCGRCSRGFPTSSSPGNGHPPASQGGARVSGVVTADGRKPCTPRAVVLHRRHVSSAAASTSAPDTQIPAGRRRRFSRPSLSRKHI